MPLLRFHGCLFEGDLIISSVYKKCLFVCFFVYNKYTHKSLESNILILQLFQVSLPFFVYVCIKLIVFKTKYFLLFFTRGIPIRHLFIARYIYASIPP